MASVTYVPSRVGGGDFTDFTAPANGSTDNGKVWAWNSGTSKFSPITLTVYETLGAVATHAALTSTHGVSGSIVGTSDNQALSNKTLGNTNTITVKAANLTVQDGTDTTKQAQFVLSGITTGTTRSYTLPDTSDTIVALGATQTLTNKTLTTPTIADFTNATHNHSSTATGGVISGSGLSATGSTTGATSQAQAFTLGVIAGIIGPSANSTTALKLTKADLSTAVVTVDTTNARVGINVTPTVALDVNGDVKFANTAVGTGSITISGGNTPTAKLTQSTGNFVLMSSNGSIESFTVANAARVLQLNPSTGGNVAVGQSSATALLDIAASTTARASLRIRSGTAPTTPNAGDCWFDGTNLRFYDGSVSRTITWT